MLLTSVPVHAQHDHHDHHCEHDHHHEEDADGQLIREGDAALSFSFDGFALGFFEGGVGGKYWLGRRTVLRAGVNVDLDFDEGEGGGGQQEGSHFGGGMRMGVEQHLGHWRRVSPYLGGVIGLHARRSRSEVVQMTPGAQPVQAERESTQLSGAADAVLGVEYFLMPHVSLAGEYAVGVRAGRRWTKAEQPRPEGEVERSEFSDTFFDFASRSPTLLLSIYF